MKQQTPPMMLYKVVMMRDDVEELQRDITLLSDFVIK